MRSYRQRIAVQKQPVKPKQKQEQPKISVKKYYPEVKEYIQKAIRMHQGILKDLEPLSDEWALCQEELFKFKTDYELLERGTYEDRKGVIEKYGR